MKEYKVRTMILGEVLCAERSAFRFYIYMKMTSENCCEDFQTAADAHFELIGPHMCL